MSTSSVKLDVFAIPRDERAKSDCDEDGGYSLVMNSFLHDGYTCSFVVPWWYYGVCCLRPG